MMWTKKWSCASSVALALTLMMMFTGACSRSQQSKVQDAKGEVQEEKKDLANEQQDAQHDIAQKQEDVNQAEQHLNEVQHEGTTDWQKDWADFRDGVNKKVADNDKLIAEKRATLASASTPMHDEFKKMIDDAEHRNHDLRDKVAEYKYQSAAAWDQFKSDTNSALDAVAAGLNQIDVKK